MGSFNSLQEEVMYNLSSQILGKQALFYPEIYDGNKEPADIAWIANRCVILIYMINSKGSFDKKRRHNLRQLRKWIKKWKAGELRGMSGGINYEINFTEIDHIVGISVVDGGEVWCQSHIDIVQELCDLKVSACATLSGSVMRELSAVGSGPRDLVKLISSFPLNNNLFEQEIAINSIRQRNRYDVDEIMRFFIKEVSTTGFNSELYHQANRILEWARSNFCDPSDISDIRSDLMSVDIKWMCIANAIFQEKLTQPKTFGKIYFRAVRQSGIYDLTVTAAANFDAAAQFITPPPKRPTIETAAIFVFPGIVQRMAFIVPRQGPSLLEQEICDIRARILS